MDVSSQEIFDLSAKKGHAKGASKLLKTIILSIFAGMFIGLGYLVYVRCVSSLGSDLGHLVGALIFPMGLVMILIGGGELFTGNTLDLTSALLVKKVSVGRYIRNLVVVFVFNALGGILAAYLFGFLLHMTTGNYGEIVNSLAVHKTEMDFVHLVLSGIGCNILVALAVWMCHGTHQFTGKVAVLWMPVFAFVFLGFQHSVANMFLLPAAYFNGALTMTQIILNIIPVWIGNFMGGAIVVSFGYYLAYKKH